MTGSAIGIGKEKGREKGNVLGSEREKLRWLPLCEGARVAARAAVPAALKGTAEAHRTFIDGTLRPSYIAGHRQRRRRRPRPRPLRHHPHARGLAGNPSSIRLRVPGDLVHIRAQYHHKRRQQRRQTRLILPRAERISAKKPQREALILIITMTLIPAETVTRRGVGNRTIRPTQFRTCAKRSARSSHKWPVWNSKSSGSNPD